MAHMTAKPYLNTQQVHLPFICLTVYLQLRVFLRVSHRHVVLLWTCELNPNYSFARLGPDHTIWTQHRISSQDLYW